MDCIHHNGYITGYLVQYEAQESGDTQTHATTGEHALIKNLIPFTTYYIKVAAVNMVGIGEFSLAIMAVTLPSEYSMEYCIFSNLIRHVIIINNLLYRCVCQFK